MIWLQNTLMGLRQLLPQLHQQKGKVSKVLLHKDFKSSLNEF